MAIDLNRLAKIWKLTTSPNAGEAAAARNRARAVVEREGKTLADVPGLLSTTQKTPSSAWSQPSGFNPLHGFDDYMEEKEPGYKAKRAREAAERQQREKDELADLVARYGSEDAIVQLSPNEAVLRAAVLKWCVFQESPYDERLIRDIDGQRDAYPLGEMKLRVRNALSKAIPLPLNITDAFAEYTMWEERDREMQLALGAMGDTQLDLPAAFRREIVRNLLEVGLRARSIAEVLIRQRYVIDSQVSQPEIDQAVLLDLEGLMAQQEGAARTASPPAAVRAASRPPAPSQPDMFA